MGVVAVAGDASTTTSVALASAWPIADDIVLVEADPTGGDLAAWFDLPVSPSLSTVVTRVLDGAWPEVDRLTRLADSGLRVIPAPARAIEAVQAIAESSRSLVSTLATLRTPITIADTGRLQSSPVAHPFVAAAAVTVVVHRQSPQSSRAAAVRLQRLADQIELLATAPSNLVVAVIGAAPFDIDEIETFLADAVGVNSVVGLPIDELAASVLGGRTGVSKRRLARLPLLRAARDLALVAERSLAEVTGGVLRAAR
jgi:MinD-like ATPase involved in chromosome partitioning or flagellar assembly